MFKIFHKYLIFRVYNHIFSYISYEETQNDIYLVDYKLLKNHYFAFVLIMHIQKHFNCSSFKNYNFLFYNILDIFVIWYCISS